MGEKFWFTTAKDVRVVATAIAKIQGEPTNGTEQDNLEHLAKEVLNAYERYLDEAGLTLCVKPAKKAKPAYSFASDPDLKPRRRF